MSLPSVQPSTEPDPPIKSYKGRAADRKALVDMQRTMFAHTQNKKVLPSVQAACARVWRDLQETKRIMDGKPLPGMLRPDGDPSKARKTARQKLPSIMTLPEVAPTGQNLPSSTPTRQELPSYSDSPPVPPQQPAEG